MKPLFKHLSTLSHTFFTGTTFRMLLFLSACTTGQVIAQSPFWLSGTYYPTSPDREEVSEFVLATTDGGSLLVGSFEFGAGDWDGRVVKLNSIGGIVWERKPGTESLDYLYSACEFSDGYVVTGKTTVNGNYRVWAIKYSLAGNVLWEKKLASNYAGTSFGGMTVIKSLGNRAIIGGFRAGFVVQQPVPTPPSSAGHLWVLESSNGAVFQDKPTAGYITYKMELKPDNSGYLAFGEVFDGSEESCYDVGDPQFKENSLTPTGPYSGYYSDIIVSALDLSTNVLESWTYGGETDDVFIDGMATIDGGFAILARTVCESVSGNTGPNNIGLYEWLLKGSEFGDLEWVQSVGARGIEGGNIPFGLTASCDDKILLGEDATNFCFGCGPGPIIVGLNKYDLDGTNLWEVAQEFDSPYFTSSYLTTTSSGGYLIISDAGWPDEDRDFYLHRWSAEPICSPNDFCTKAISVFCGQFLANQTTVGESSSITNYSCISGASFTGPDKVYKITLNQTSDLQIGLEILQPNVDLDLFLLSDNCATATCLDWSIKPNVQNDNNPFTNKEGIAKSLSAGTYYIVVDGYNADQQGSFNIDFACGKLNCASVTTLVCGTPYSSTTATGSNNVSIYNLTPGLEDDVPAALNDPAKLMDVNNAGPERIHQFTINQQSAVTITLTGVPANVDLELFLLNTNCIGKTCIAKSVLPAGQNETIITTLSPGTYFVIVDGFRNDFGAYTLTVNCGNCPPPGNNFNCGIVKCYYSGDGNNLQYTFTANQGIAPGYNWKITGNNLNVTGGTGTSYTYSFSTPGTYQICYPYLSNNGCVEYCCVNLCVINPFDCDGSIMPAFDPNANAWRFRLEGVASNIEWRDDDTGQSLGNSVLSNFIPVPNPCNSAIPKTVSVSYFDGNCYRVCCFRYYPCNPFDCGLITYDYDQNALGYRFQLNTIGGFDQNTITWTVDSPVNQSLGNGNPQSNLLPLPATCSEYWVSVRFKDGTGAWKVCCIKIFVCNPFACLDFGYNYVPAGNGYQFVLNQAGASNISWTLDDTNTSLGVGTTSSILPIPPGNCIERTVTVRYFWNGVWYICCRKMLLCNNPFDCLDFSYNYVPAGNGYQFVLNQAGASNISWTLDDTNSSLGVGATSLILPIPPGNCIIRTVTVRYFWNGAWYICCRKMLLCNNPLDCTDFGYNYVPASNGYQFVLNQAGASNISWTLDDTNSSLGVGATSLILPIPPGNCIERTVTVRYFWDGSWYICCRKMLLCNNPLDCTDFDYNYIPASNGYQFVLNQGGASNISWTLDDTNSSLGVGATSTILPIPPGNCIERTVTVRYFWNGAWYICCRKMLLCNNPLNCTEFSFNYVPASNGYQFVLNQGGASNISWTIDDTGASLGIGVTSLVLPIPPGNCLERTITVRYFWNGAWYICCRKIWLCSPISCSGEINHSWQNNNLLNLSINPVYQGVVWRLENGTLLGNGNNITIPNPGPNTVVCVSYLDLGNTWRVCCKSVGNPPNPASDLSFDIDDNVCASSNSIVDIPVRVRNFNNVLSFEMSVKSLNSSFAQLVSIAAGGLNGAGSFQVLDPTTGVLSWFSPTPVSVPDNSVACILRVNLTGNAGASGLIEFSGTPTAVSAEQVQNGNQTTVLPLLFGGSTCIISNITISGKITREDNLGVGSVTVELTGSSTQSTTTDAQGNYSFNGVAAGGSYVITPNKDIGDKNGVTGGDLVAIQRHILALEPLGSPFKRIAADANNTQGITGGDLVSIQRLILSLDPALLANQSWRFVDKNWTFANPSSPWALPFPEKITLNNLSNNINNADFIGIKIADVNLSNNPNMLGHQNVDSRDPSLTLETRYHLEQPRGKVFYPVSVSENCNLESIQFSLSYDRNFLTFRGITSNVLTGFSSNNFGEPLKDQGIVTIVWATNGDPVNLKPREEVMWLEFDYHDNIQDPENFALYLLSDPTEAIATTAGDNSKQLKWVNLMHEQPQFNHRVQPNPFSDKGVLLIELPDKDALEIAVYNANGQRVFILQEDFNAGLHAISLACDECRDTQILFYQIRGSHFTGSGKVIFLKQ